MVDEAFLRFLSNDSSRSFNLSYKAGSGGEADAYWEVRYTDIAKDESQMTGRAYRVAQPLTTP